jgi:carboxypeptidase C (cathepsin A)
MEGATTELGPLVLLDVKEACQTGPCDYTLQLSVNPYAWNAHANVLFLDQPRTVGFSFGYPTGGTTVHSSVAAAQDFLVFYRGFLAIWPEFVGRPLLIAGESYAGHYLPAFASAILAWNQATQGTTAAIDFAGVAIGNGCVNDTMQNFTAFRQFQWQNNLIPASSYPTRWSEANALMNAYVGYEPNYYDFRLQSVTCPACYRYECGCMRLSHVPCACMYVCLCV